jgi:hypothetical protein
VPTRLVEPVFHLPLQHRPTLVGELGTIDIERICIASSALDLAQLKEGLTSSSAGVRLELLSDLLHKRCLPRACVPGYHDTRCCVHQNSSVQHSRRTGTNSPGTLDDAIDLAARTLVTCERMASSLSCTPARGVRVGLEGPATGLRRDYQRRRMETSTGRLTLLRSSVRLVQLPPPLPCAQQAREGWRIYTTIVSSNRQGRGFPLTSATRTLPILLHPPVPDPDAASLRPKRDRLRRSSPP